MTQVMLVDDEDEICEFLAQVLRERCGFETDTALTGEKALELLEKKEYQLCVIDLKLATALTGLDVIAAIRERQPKARVVAMSGYIDIGMRQKAEHLGVTDFFEKPQDIQPDIFEMKVKALVQN